MLKVISVFVLVNMFGIDDVKTTSSAEPEPVQQEASLHNKNKTVASHGETTEQN
jgi:hypothetical protein